MTARRKRHLLDLDFWVASMRKSLEERAGRRRWRSFIRRVLARVGDGDALPLEHDPSALRCLWRLGLASIGAAAQKEVASLVRRASEASASPPVEVTLLVRCFASGCYGFLDKGVCSDTPECTSCPFALFCRYASARGSPELPPSESFSARLALGALGALGVPELLALIISGGRSEMKAFRTAEKLLSKAASLRSLATWTVKEFESVGGVTHEAALRLRSALDLAVYWAVEPRPPGARFSQARDFVKYYGPRLRDLQAEYFIVALLDNKNRLVGEVVTGGGGLSGATVDPKVVLKRAVRDAAAHVAFLHNHPSGDPTPSPEDLDITARLVQVCALAGVRVIDHVIIGGDAYTSMSESGYI
ncbi:MAG TPA: hypothetical protein ENN09_01215 [Planctomycetes bacterium]|nr:hypothetical protein [Planctomycetota bacterium]